MNKRQILDASLIKKPLWFWIFFPFFFFVSFIWGIFSLKKHFQKPKYKSCYEIFCVGNVVVGGVGKSPVVRKIAIDFINKGKNVFILTRGYKSKYRNIFVTKESLCFNLSDEAMEHWQMLYKEGLVGLAQYEKREEGILCIEKYCEERKIENVLVILDDGLQNKSLFYDKTFCVWNPSSFLNSPFWCLPVGPYREAFPLTKKMLLEKFSYRVWSRESFEKKDLFYEKVRKCISCFSYRDIFCFYKISFLNLKKELFIKERVIGKKVGVVCGIAYPQPFFQEVRHFLGKDDLSLYSYGDHDSLFKRRDWEKNDIIFITAKDFYRHPKEFENLSLEVVVAFIDLLFYDKDPKEFIF